MYVGALLHRRPACDNGVCLLLMVVSDWAGIGRCVYSCSEQVLYSLTGAHEENPVRGRPAMSFCVNFVCGPMLSSCLHHVCPQTFLLPCRHVFSHGQRPVSVVGPLLEEEGRKVHVGFWTDEETAGDGADDAAATEEHA